MLCSLQIERMWLTKMKPDCCGFAARGGQKDPKGVSVRLGGGEKVEIELQAAETQARPSEAVSRHRAERRGAASCELGPFAGACQTRVQGGSLTMRCVAVGGNFLGLATATALLRSEGRSCTALHGAARPIQVVALGRQRTCICRLTLQRAL